MNKHTEYAVSELTKNGMIDTDIGKNIITLLDSITKISTNQIVMLSICDMISRIIQGKPVLAIDETDFDTTPDELGHIRCKRYAPVYKNIHTGKYYDEHACVYYNEGASIFVPGFGEDSTTREISLPYYPQLPIELYSELYNVKR
jgi:hypothetical protein